MLQRAAKPLPDAWLQVGSDSPTWLLSARADAETDANAQYELGLEYLRGTRLPENIRLAAHWLRKAAEARHAKAAYLMALLTRSGEGAAPSVANFFRYLQVAAMQGVAAAQAEMGKLYSRGILLQRDLVRARELFLAAASSGDVIAMKQLARLPVCLAGDHRKQRDSQHWWDRAVAVGDAEALFQIASSSSDDDQRLALLHKAAELNYPDALCQLGELYREPSVRSRGPRRDCEKATCLLSRACTVLKAQASKLKEEAETHQLKWEHAVNEFEEYREEQLCRQRVLKAWQSVASCQRQVLQTCMDRCSQRWKRFAWKRLVWNRNGYESYQSFQIACPLHRAVLRQRVFTSWRFLKHECNLSLVKRILQRSFSMRASTSKACACRRLCRILQECVCKQYDHCLRRWRQRTRHIVAAKRLSRALKRYLCNRCYESALDTWRCWMGTHGSKYASEERELEARLAALRDASEALLVQHGVELDTWRLRCDEEAARISSLEFSEASDTKPSAQMERLGDGFVPLHEPTWPGKFEEPKLRRPTEDQGAVVPTMQSKPRYVEGLDGTGQFPSLEQSSRSSESSARINALPDRAQDGSVGLGAKMRFSDCLSDRRSYLHLGARSNTTPSTQNHLDDFRTIPLLLPIQRHQRQVGPQNVAREKLDTTTRELSGSLSPVLHETSTFADGRPKSFSSSSTSWKHDSFLTSNASIDQPAQACSKRIGDIDSNACSLGFKKPTSSGRGQRNTCGIGDSCTRRSYTLLETTRSNSDSDSCSSSGSGPLETINANEIIKSFERRSRVPSCLPQSQSFPDFSHQRSRVHENSLSSEIPQTDSRSPFRQMFKASAMASVATPTRVGSQGGTIDALSRQLSKDNLSDFIGRRRGNHEARPAWSSLT